MQAAERRSILDDVSRDSAELVRLIAAELWDDAVALARTRAAKVARLFSGALAPEERQEMAPVLREVVCNDESLIKGLERRRAAVYNALVSMQNGRDAVAAYGHAG